MSWEVRRTEYQGGSRLLAVDVSVIVPTYNEAENLPLLLPALIEALGGISAEIIVVDDDSPDETWRVADEDREPSS